MKFSILKHIYLSALAVIFLTPVFGCVVDDVAKEESSAQLGAGDASGDKRFVRSSGSSHLIVGEGDDTIFLRGVNLAYDRVSSSDPNEPWRIADHTDWGAPVLGWYQEKHFELIRDIGFNVARVNLSYRIFEDNAAPGEWKTSAWQLIDQLIQWGKDSSVYLILDMHIAPGGAGIVSCMGCGWRTWDEPVYQDRFIALWRAIAERYRNEPQIAAFGLLNEPAPTQSAAQWQVLAQALIDAIREVDQNHLIVLEMPNWIFDSNNQSPLVNYDLDVLNAFQFLVDDANVMYDFHYYLPATYTLQDETGVDGGQYPDASAQELTLAGTVVARDHDYLLGEMTSVTDYWRENQVPANFGEWGVADSALSVDSQKGGLKYLGDMLELMDFHGLSWQFYYLNRLYNIECCFEDNPTTVINQELIDLFSQHLLE